MDTYNFYESVGPSVCIKSCRKRNNAPYKCEEKESNFSINAFNKEMALMKLKLPFLTKSQIQGRTMDKFGIPNIMGKPYKKNDRIGSITFTSVNHIFSLLKRSFSEQKRCNKHLFENRRHTIAGTYVPIDIITNKINRMNKSKALRNLQNVFKLYSEENDMSDENYSIESPSKSSQQEDFSIDQAFSEWESDEDIVYDKPEPMKSIKTYERRKSDNFQSNFYRKEKNNKIDKDNNRFHLNNNPRKGMLIIGKTLQGNINDDTPREKKRKQCVIQQTKTLNFEEKFSPKKKSTPKNNHDENRKIEQIRQTQSDKDKPDSNGYSKKASKSISDDFIETESKILDESTNNSNKTSLKISKDHKSDESSEMDRKIDNSQSSNRDHNFHECEDLADENSNISEEENGSDSNVCKTNYNIGPVEEDPDEIMIIYEYPPKNKIHVGKTPLSNKINYSPAKKNRLNNYLIFKDNGLKKTSVTSNSSGKEYFEKRLKKIKQSISVYPNKLVLNDGSENSSINRSFNTGILNVTNNTYTSRVIKTSVSESNMDKVSTMKSLRNKKLENLRENTLILQKNEENKRKYKKISECIILIDGQMQTNSNTSIDTEVTDIDRGSKDSSSSEEMSGKVKSYPNSSDGCTSENINDLSPNSAGIQDESSPQLRDDSLSVSDNDNHNFNDINSNEDDVEISKHFKDRNVQFSPHFATSTRLSLEDSDNSSNGFETSQNNSESASHTPQITLNARSGHIEEEKNLQIDEEGYYLANLFDFDTTLPHQRTLRSTSMREITSDENDKPSFVD